MSDPAVILPPHRGKPRKKTSLGPVVRQKPEVARVSVRVPAAVKRRLRMATVANDMNTAEVISHLATQIDSEGHFRFKAEPL